MVPIPESVSSLVESTPGLIGTITLGFLLVASVIGYIGYRFHLANKSASETPYPAYGVVGPQITTIIDASKCPKKDGAKVLNGKTLLVNGDRKLAESAEIFHYQSQKQQISGSSHPATKRLPSASDSEDDAEENGYIVYECPGLAPTGEMEVKNPLFQDDSFATPGAGSPKDRSPEDRSPKK